MKSTTPKVSIIVPVYNAGIYFAKCMDTLVNQTLREIEIILVIDCPTDETDKIAKEYAAKDNRILIIENKINLHIGNSRNKGIEAARGEYIGFSDHDDYREPAMYEGLYQEAKKNDSDLVLGSNIYLGNDHKTTHVPSNLNENELKEFALTDLLLGGDDQTLTPVFANIHPNIYKSSFLKKNNLSFVDTKVVTPEDRIFQTMCLVCADKVKYNSNSYYFHLLHNESAVNLPEYKECAKRAKGKNIIYEFLLVYNIYDKYEEYFLRSVKKEFSNCLINLFINEKKLSKLIKVATHLKSYPFTRKAFRSVSYSTRYYRLGGKISRFIIAQWMKL